MTNVDFIKNTVDTAAVNILNTLQLLAEDATIPFISRYRKDQTGNLDEVMIEQIAKAQKEFEIIVKRKEAILKSIAEQKLLSAELDQKIRQSFDLQQLEDFYLPFKKKKKTRADVARENGLEPLAKIILDQNENNIDRVASQYLNHTITRKEAALQGARDIIAEWINENIAVRQLLRRLFHRKANITTKAVKVQKETLEAQKFNQYFDWTEPLSKVPSHRLLAMLRAEKEGFVKIKIEVNLENSEESVPDMIAKLLLKAKNGSTPQLKTAIEDSYKRLLSPAISNEALQEAKVKADTNSIQVFANNLRQLLLAPPLGAKRILAIDPGFRSGCKVVCLDENGALLYNETIYPHAPQKEEVMALKKIRSMVNSYKIDAIAIGNGTASRETEFFIKKIAFEKAIQVFVVSEAGASVYSASKIARDESPHFDVTVRGSVSIGRRLADPLAELVKIDPKAIGVGQYQHDVDQAKLKEELDRTVVRCVNSVGININTASRHLLGYVSGIGEKLAENIVRYRSENGPFLERQQLKKVPRLGDKAYQQGVAFIRISDAKNPLDNSAVHPEAYAIVEKMAKDLKLSVKDLLANTAKTALIKPENYITAEIGLLGLKDIIKELEKPGLDPRKSAQVFEFNTNVKTIRDLKTGMILPGIVNNITNFGCFVDIGIKESGLVHISQLKEGFVSDVNEVVKLHQHIQVRVTEVAEERKRIQLSMII
ncbi:MAG: RNA-binding transcriptional accessory protein [Burkholderiales bacterium]|nr:RNA-binding transcriptional accessory protein [Flavobacterium sp.]